MLFQRSIAVLAACSIAVCSAQAQNANYPSYPSAAGAPTAPTAAVAQAAPAPAAEPLAAPVPAVQPRAAAPAPGARDRGRSPAELKPLGLEQKAWSNPRENMGPRQSMPGFLRVTWRPDTVTTINIREGMLSVIRWPISETILSRELSDSKTFESRIGPDQRSIIVRSVFSGVDGNMVVYGQSGNVYNIYLRSTPFNNDKLPDTTVEMIVEGLGSNYGGTLHSTAPASAPYDDYRDLYKPAVTSRVEEFKAGSREWASISPVNGKDMNTNIDILVPDKADQAIAPIRAWHDKNFTYLDFGPNASSMNQWPVASLITDGSESPIGSRTTGPNGSIMIIEAIGDIVLRNGRHMVCLKLRNQPDNRVSPSSKVARTDALATPAPAIAEPAPAASRPVAAKPAKAQKIIRKGEAKPVAAKPMAAASVKPVVPVKETPRAFQFDASGLTGKIH